MPKLRIRPSEIVAKDRISARKVFSNEVKKVLPIPRAINVYNNSINRVDIANQLRYNRTVARPSILI